MALDPRDVCPKCQEARRPNAAACPRCGLSVAHWGTFLRPQVQPSPVLASAWAKLQANWSDDAAHKRVLDLAANQHELDTIAALYRAQLDERPDDPFAKAGLERAAHLASVLGVQRSASAAGKPETPRAVRIAAVLVAGGLLLIVLQLLRLSLRH